MASFNFYLQQPYKQSDKTNPEEAKQENKKNQDRIKQFKKEHKQIPNRLFNPKETTVYLMVTIDRSNRIKLKTDEKALAKNWDISKGVVKNNVTGHIDINNRLTELKSLVSSVNMTFLITSPPSRETQSNWVCT